MWAYKPGASIFPTRIEYRDNERCHDDDEDRDQIAAAALRRARRVLGDDLKPQEVIVVGDTPRDIECGRAIGARVLAVATGGAMLPELQDHQPDWAVEDLRTLEARAVCNGHA